MTWSESSSKAQAHGILACDFLTVETLRPKTICVPFFIELRTRRVHAAAVTTHPDSAWVSQQARNLAPALEDRAMPIRFLVRDRDAKYSAPSTRSSGLRASP